MTLGTFKKFEEFVNEELDNFMEDFDSQRDNFKFPVDIKTRKHKISSKSFEIEPKKKVKSFKVKKIWNKSNTDKGLF